MPNRPRPRCPTCDTAMGPVFRKGPRGKAYVRIPDAFHCAEHNVLQEGRPARSGKVAMRGLAVSARRA